MPVPSNIVKWLKEWAVRLAALSLIGVVAALLVAYSGVYNVAASQGHPAWLDWFLATGMRHSVLRQSSDIVAPNLDPAGIAPAASHFHNGCGRCHGTPGKPRNPVYAHMLPTPPDLNGKIGRWNDANLFWIVRHGLQYAGMPAWSGGSREDEVWAMVAFLRLLPELDEAEYTALTAGNLTVSTWTAAEIAAGDDTILQLTACERCHDTGTAAPTSALVPRLSGQSLAYLESALRDYRDGRRHSGFMEPVAALLSEADISRLAAHYANLPGNAWRSSAAASADILAAGEELAVKGAPVRDIPSCNSCHAANSLAIYPRLAGLSAAYIANQLRLWRQGHRRQSATGRLMGVVADRLSNEQILAAALYYESLPPAVLVK